MNEIESQETCLNCGGWKGIHHFRTLQCPMGGTEAAKGPQEWEQTVFRAKFTFTESSLINSLEKLIELAEKTRFATDVNVLQAKEKLILIRAV